MPSRPAGNCIRNVTADQFAGASAEEIEDPRPLAEIIRQWSSLHPEFVFLARKFKIAVGASPHDRAALQFHDMAVEVVRNAQGRTGYKVIAGGGMGRTPYIAQVMREFVEREDILAYLEAVAARLQPGQPPRQSSQAAHQDPDQRHRRRGKCAAASPASSTRSRPPAACNCPRAELDRITAYFAPPKFETGLADEIPAGGKDFADWTQTNIHAHRAPGYAIATISLKTIGQVPGDASADQMDAIADLMDEYSVGEIRRHP